METEEALKVKITGTSEELQSALQEGVESFEALQSAAAKAGASEIVDGENARKAAGNVRKVTDEVKKTGGALGQLRDRVKQAAADTTALAGSFVASLASVEGIKKTFEAVVKTVRQMYDEWVDGLKRTVELSRESQSELAGTEKLHEGRTQSLQKAIDLLQQQSVIQGHLNHVQRQAAKEAADTVKAVSGIEVAFDAATGKASNLSSVMGESLGFAYRRGVQDIDNQIAAARAALESQRKITEETGSYAYRALHGGSETVASAKEEGRIQKQISELLARRRELLKSSPELLSLDRRAAALRDMGELEIKQARETAKKAAEESAKAYSAYLAARRRLFTASKDAEERREAVSAYRSSLLSARVAAVRSRRAFAAFQASGIPASNELASLDEARVRASESRSSWLSSRSETERRISSDISSREAAKAATRENTIAREAAKAAERGAETMLKASTSLEAAAQALDTLGSHSLFIRF